MVAAAMTRKIMTRAASPSPESPFGPGSWLISLAPPRRWRVMWDMFTDAQPCLDGRCVAKSDSQISTRWKKRNICASAAPRNRNVNQRFQSAQQFQWEWNHQLRLRNYVTENPLTPEAGQHLNSGRFFRLAAAERQNIPFRNARVPFAREPRIPRSNLPVKF